MEGNLNREVPKPTVEQMIAYKKREIIAAKKPKDIYAAIDWCDQEPANIAEEERPLYENDFEDLQEFAVNQLLAKLDKAPDSKNWSEQLKATVTEHVERLSQINMEKLKKISAALKAAQEAAEKDPFNYNFKVVNLTNELKKYQEIQKAITTTNKKIQKKAT